MSRLVAVPAATSTQGSGPPTDTPAWSRPTLPRKPEKGGMPARFIAGTKKSTASSGAIRARPPSRRRSVLPARSSTSPATRKSVVWMVMWCTT